MHRTYMLLFKRPCRSVAFMNTFIPRKDKQKNNNGNNNNYKKKRENI